MYVSFDIEQAQVLLEMLENTLTQLRLETARTDNRDFRMMLRHREDVIRSMLAKLVTPPAAQLS